MKKTPYLLLYGVLMVVVFGPAYLWLNTSEAPVSTNTSTKDVTHNTSASQQADKAQPEPPVVLATKIQIPNTQEQITSSAKKENNSLEVRFAELTRQLAGLEENNMNLLIQELNQKVAHLETTYGTISPDDIPLSPSIDEMQTKLNALR